MFTTGNHLYLYAAFALYFIAAVFYATKKRPLELAALSTGVLVHSLYLAGRGWLAGVFYANPIFEGPFFLPLCLGVILLITRTRKPSTPCLPIFITLFLFSVLALVYAKGVIPPTPKKMSIFASFFFLTENMGHALFYCGLAMSLITLIKKREDDPIHPYLVWGFVFFSVSQVVGAYWCYVGWGNTFSWGARHFSSATIWLLYAAYIHLKFTLGWDKKKRAFFSIVAGLVTFVISYGHYLHEMAFPRVGG